ncbi:hypothetical protein [Streptomyces sp. HPF1205]|uniref:hypothetical protein n=1 Tax=Streptomyces sp. HPF1205 TaxID=2873262 RepID=UPI001CED824C|nr:hypothetical protein [Streptomyces sp. HPF1205]
MHQDGGGSGGLPRRPGTWTAARMAREAFSGFAKEGGRIGSGSLGSGTGGVARCAR